MTQPAHAYAGPGVAIGAIVVFFTVILAFFASTIISFFKLIQKAFRKVFKRKSTIVKKNNDNKWNIY